MKGKYNKDYMELMKEKWKTKSVHGKFPGYLYNEYIDIEQSFKWIKHSGLKGETDGLIVAVHDQTLNTRYYSKHIRKQGLMDQMWYVLKS